MERKKLKISNAALLIALLLTAGCRAPFVPSDKDVFLQQTDVCMVAGKKEYIGGTTGKTQSSYNPTKHMFRGGNVDVVRDSTLNLTVETVNSYYVLTADAVPGAEGTTVNGILYLKHPSLPNSYRTYGTATKPACFEVIRDAGNMVWLWENSLRIGVVVKFSSTEQGR